MDINDIRAWHTVIMLAVFLGIVWWAYSRKRKARFDEASQLPFNEPEQPANETKRNQTESGDHP
jgi:cytochrome c oxidase cbb3-type subunit 4